MQRNIGTTLQLQRRFVSEVELEQVTGISRRTWQKHRLLNRGPRYYKIHGSIRYELEEVLAWIKTLAVAAGDGAAGPHDGAVA
jgi:predicted DNA-binding transcriptional regulator AlpA